MLTPCLAKELSRFSIQEYSYTLSINLLPYDNEANILVFLKNCNHFRENILNMISMTVFSAL